MRCNRNIYHQFVQDFSQQLSKLVENREFSYLIFVCIGTDKITGDSFGPLVGYKLNNFYQEMPEIKVIGNLENTVCATNIVETVETINQSYKDSFIIAIDSAVSDEKNIGKIFVENNSLQLGSGLNKKILSIGDISIKAVVSKNLKIPKYNFKLLQNIPLGFIMELADITANGIYNVIQL